MHKDKLHKSQYAENTPRWVSFVVSLALFLTAWFMSPILIPSQMVYANAPIINGRLMDTGTNTPLGSWWIRWTDGGDDDGNVGVRYVSTDANGYFSFPSWQDMKDGERSATANNLIDHDWNPNTPNVNQSSRNDGDHYGCGEHNHTFTAIPPYGVFGTASTFVFDKNSNTPHPEMSNGADSYDISLTYSPATAPTGLQASCTNTITGTSATISWNAVPGVGFYAVRMDDSSDNIAYACDTNSLGTTNVCRDTTAGSITLSVAPGHANYFWMHSGYYWGTSSNFTFTCEAPPDGFFYGVDNSACTVSGWACDRSKPDQTVRVDLYHTNDAFHTPNQWVGNVNDANIYQSNLVAAGVCGGNGYHGWTYDLDNSTTTNFRDGVTRSLYGHAIGINMYGNPNSENPVIGWSPQTVACVTLTPTNTPVPPTNTPTNTPTTTLTPTRTPTMTPTITLTPTAPASTTSCDAVCADKGMVASSICSANGSCSSGHSGQYCMQEVVGGACTRISTSCSTTFPTSSASSIQCCCTNPPDPRCTITPTRTITPTPTITKTPTITPTGQLGCGSPCDPSDNKCPATCNTCAMTNGTYRCVRPTSPPPTITKTPTITPTGQLGCGSPCDPSDNKCPATCNTCAMTNGTYRCVRTSTTPTITITVTPSQTATPMPDLNIGGNFRQDTNGNIRPATIYKPIEVDEVNVGNIIALPAGCVTRQCSQSIPNVSYICTVGFSTSCVPTLPQDFPINGIMPPNIAPPYYENAQTIVGLIPPIAEDEDFGNPPLDFKYLGGAWIKLKDTSFTRYPGATAKMVNNIPFITESFDGDDDSGKIGMIDETSLGGAGYVAGDNTFVDIRPLDVVSYQNDFRIDSPSYTLGTDKTSMAASIRYQIDSILNTKSITQAAVDINGDVTLTRGTIYEIDGASITIDDIILNGGNVDDPTILIIKNDANLGTRLGAVTFNKNINVSSGSPLLIFADDMTLSPTVSEIHGIFISLGTFSTGASGSTLEIAGNLVALDGIDQKRDRTGGDHAKPTVFVVFDAGMYMKLFPLITLNEIQRR